MAMTDDEWEAVSLLMENCWRGEFDDTTSGAYRTMLRNFNASEVMDSLHVLAENGKPFLPAVPEIIAAIRASQESPLPAWPEVWRYFERSFRRRSETEALGFLEEIHPFLAAFMRVEGWERLKMEPFYEPEYGPLRIKELKERWEEFVEKGTERVRQGRALEARTGNAGGLPTKLDASAIIGAIPNNQKQIGEGNG